MKSIFYLLAFFLFSRHSFGQREAANWYFGYFTGATFNSSSPSILRDSKMQSEEGSASISDSHGNLLFYSNGRSLLNRSHTLLKNSDGLLGDRSSTQNIVIIPQPGNDSIYFVFTVGSIQTENSGCYYSLVNMRRENGLGELIQKNTLLLQGSYEKIAAVRHCNNRDVWVTVRKWESDQYYSYLVSTNGVQSTPVISTTGFMVGGDLQNSVGAMKFSVHGNKLAAAFGYGIDKVELLDFDNQTGMLSNSILFTANTFTGTLEFSGTYGLEFSPNDDLLYISVYNTVDDPAILYQFNISNPNGASIEASRLNLSQIPFGGIGNIQIALDGKLYVALPGKKYLGVINDPDVAGTGCNFQLNGIEVVEAGGGHTVRLGLPTFMQGYFNSSFLAYDFENLPGSCLDKNIVFKINHLNGIDSLHWYFGDATESTVLSATQSHTYLSAGFYDVKLKIFRSGGCVSQTEDVIIKQIWIADSPYFLGNDKEGCELGDVILETTASGVNFLWSNGTTANSITVNSAGVYWLELEKNGCTLRDSVTLTKILPPAIDLGPDDIVCANKPVKLNAGINNASYLWSTGETRKEISVNRPGKYVVTVTPDLNGCVASDSINLAWGDCELLLPTAFSPNGDDVNELFGLASGIMVRSFSMKIYNRYGQLIFHTSDQSKKWDGKFKNKIMPTGLYPWIINYTNKNGFSDVEKGTVLLIR